MDGEIEDVISSVVMMIKYLLIIVFMTAALNAAQQVPDHCCYRIEEVSTYGGEIKISDGSAWEILIYGPLKSMYWEPQERISLSHFKGEDFEIYNWDRSEHVYAKLLATPDCYSKNLLYITEIQDRGREIHLNNGVILKSNHAVEQRKVDLDDAVTLLFNKRGSSGLFNWTSWVLINDYTVD